MSEERRVGEAIGVILAWHDALNRRDLDALFAVSAEAIVLGGPRGAANGRATLAEWMELSGIRLDPGAIFIGDAAVLVRQAARWPGSTKAASVYSTFVVADGLVAAIHRYDVEADALEAAGFSELPASSWRSDQVGANDTPTA